MGSTEPVRSGCFGFSVHSPFPLCYLRDGGQDLLDLHEAREPAGEAGTLIYEWNPTPVHPLHARLYREGDRYRFWVHGMGAFIIDPGTLQIQMPPAADRVQLEERLWGWPAIVCVLHRGDLAMHAAAADAGGASVLLGAPGRFGKSTLVTAFHQAGHRVLSEDLSRVRWATPAAVLPGPAMLRIRRDVMDRLTLSGAQVVRDDPERCSVAIDAGRRGSCDPVPLRAVVLLREASEGIRLERVPFTDALPDLWNLSFHLPTPESRARCFQAVVELAKAVPTWNLFRPLRYEGLPDAVDQIVEQCLAGAAHP